MARSPALLCLMLPLTMACDDSKPAQSLLGEDFGLTDDSGGSGADTDTGTPADTDTDSGSAGDSDSDTDSGPLAYDCSALPDFNQGDTTLSGARAYHGLTWDTEGHLVGYDGSNSLVKSSYDGTNSLYVPGVHSVEQLDRLPGGDIVLYESSTGSLERYTAEGGSTVIASGIPAAYGVTVGPDGKVWVANGGVTRFDPDTGEREVVLSPPMDWTAHSLAFNLDSTVLYIGTVSGPLRSLALDEDLNAAAEPEIVADVGSGWHDGIAVDACGNLYVASYFSLSLFRVGTDGTVTEMVHGGAAPVYGHGAVWGSGEGGWRDDAIYQPQPYGGATVREVVIGLPSGSTVRTWKGELVGR